MLRNKLSIYYIMEEVRKIYAKFISYLQDKGVMTKPQYPDIEKILKEKEARDIIINRGRTRFHP